MSAPTYAVRNPETGDIIPNLSWANASEQVRLYGKEWVHDYPEVLKKAQEEARKNSNTEGNTRKLSPEEEAKINAPDMFAAAQVAVAGLAEMGSSDLADLTREELFEMAEDKYGLKIDRRTGHAKLVEAIEKARAAEPAADAAETTEETSVEE
ncbi:hypothetical protein KEU06_09585 [Pseudaminobacter sp. 19-2017]|uniref:Uncharacterized protein n=1 Tax=Pseudaminobacter soli (ex Zhang et al. 2022) TaxID=2831468 RepID=A0A942I209_9HYPH|nr:hypothetical protein [Pseudaminobacter soli]MBS3648857.1 hypothetical protein [Pseudaminobacter soli]